MRRGSIITMALGAAGATAALVASPGTYEWLRRVTGRDTDRHHYESDFAVEDLGDLGLDDEASVETDDLRLSLRARLAESGGDVGVVNAEASESDGIDDDDVDQVSASRARVRAKAREARARIVGDSEPGEE
jgi:hypothetical protein